MCVGGVVQTTFYLLVDSCKEWWQVLPYGGRYMNHWALPKGKSTNKRAKSNSEAKTFKPTASKLLAFVPILACLCGGLLSQLGVYQNAVADLMENVQSVSYGYYKPTIIREKVSQMQLT